MAPPFYRLIIPLHHSASIFALQSERKWNAVETNENDSLPASSLSAPVGVDESASSMQTFDTLILRCHSEGVMWRGLLPMLVSGSTTAQPSASDLMPLDGQREKECRHHKSSIMEEDGIYCSISCTRTEEGSAYRSALSILVNHFHNHICHIAFRRSGCEERHRGQESKSDQDSRPKYCNIDVADADGNNSKKDNNIPKANILLILLPPNPNHTFLRYYSRMPSTSPLNTFALRLIRLEKTFVRLTSLSAYISTLGGGFFLCQYLSTAISLARQQHHIALLRGDIEMALKCRINEGYCYIHSGKFRRGKKVIRRVLRDVLHLKAERGGLETEEGMLHHSEGRELSELTVITNMCRSALRFADILICEVEKKATCAGRGGEILSGGHKTIYKGDEMKGQLSRTHDDFQRIRIIRDKKLMR
ncbi:hypothetical protein ACHAWF_004576 [Thalassiosira exigua]